MNEHETNEEHEITPTVMQDDEPGEVLRPDVVALLATIAATEPSRAADLLQAMIGNTGVHDRVVTPAGSRGYRWSDHSTPLLDEAMAQAVGKIRNASKNRVNEHLRSSYADLASVWDACREACHEAGVWPTQTIWSKRGYVVVTTRLAHKGQWVEADLAVTAEQTKGVNSKQALGIAITYAKRYMLVSMLGIPTGEEDTDGEDGSEREPPAQNAQQRWRGLVQQAASLNIRPQVMLARVSKSNPGELTNRDLAQLANWLNEQANAGG